ncbi:MAG: hypothetical protein Q9227_000229 [Pyrenula ochraceoflavens]
MRFSLFPTVLLGLTTTGVIQAAPSNLERALAARDALPRNLPYTFNAIEKRSPGNGNDNKDDNKDNNKNKNNDKNNNNDVVIQEKQVTKVVDIIKADGNNVEEVQIVQKVTQLVIKNKGNNKKKNNKRKNDMKNKHKNQNIVIQVVQVIIDAKSGGKRYAQQQMLADNGSNSTITCQMTDAATMTINNNQNCAGQAAATDAAASGVSGAAAATGMMVAAGGAAASDVAGAAAASGVMVADATNAAAAMAMATAGSAADMQNVIMLMPADAAAPAVPEGAELMDDSASDMANGTVTDLSGCAQ